MALGAVALTAFAITGRLLPGEVSFAQAIQETPGGHTIQAIAAALASPFAEYTLVGAVALLALRVRDYPLAAAAMLVMAGMALNPAIKGLVERDRPSGVDLTIREHASGFGYPSGHVQEATLVYGYAVLAGTRHLSRAVAYAVAAAALIAVTAIAFNRVYNGAHWPSDVAGGAAIGILVVVAAIRLPEWVRHRVDAARSGVVPVDG